MFQMFQIKKFGTVEIRAGQFQLDPMLEIKYSSLVC